MLQNSKCFTNFVCGVDCLNYVRYLCCFFPLSFFLSIKMSVILITLALFIDMSGSTSRLVTIDNVTCVVNKSSLRSPIPGDDEIPGD